MVVTIKIKGIPEVKRFLKKKNKSILRELSSALNVSVLFLEKEVKQSISQGTNAPRAFDTGNFARNTTSEVGKFIVRVKNDTPYGPMIEFGTSRMAPRPHFENTAAKNKLKISEFIAARIKKVTKRPEV